MSRRSLSTSSALYQVDLIAALFSGFIVVWLTTSADTTTFAEGTEPIYVALEILRQYSNKTVGSLIPSDSMNNCAPSRIVDRFAEQFASTRRCHLDVEPEKRISPSNYWKDSTEKFTKLISARHPGQSINSLPIELAEGKTIEGMKFVGLPKAASLGSFLFSRNFTWSAPDAEFHRLPPAQQVALFVLPAQAISDDLMIAGVDYDATIKGHSTKFHELAAAGGPILFGYATFLAVQPTDEGPWIEDRIRLCFSTSKDRSFCLEGRRAFGDASPALLTRTAS